MTRSPSRRFEANAQPAPRRLNRFFTAIVLGGIGLFVLDAAWKALRAPWAVDDFPEALAVKVELLPWLFPLHMVTGGLALVLVPLALAARLRPRWHRHVGKITAPVVLVAGLTAFPVALVAPVTPLSAWGFAAQGAVWIALLSAGLWNIRRRRIAAHRACMLLMAATTSGALFFRIYLALFALYGDVRHYETFYAIDAWIAWSLPLIVMTLFLKRESNRTGAIRGNPQ